MEKKYPNTTPVFAAEQLEMANDAEAATNPQALAAYAAKHARIFYIVGRIPDDAAAARVQAAQQWLDTHYHLVNHIVTSTVTISLYATGA